MTDQPKTRKTILRLVVEIDRTADALDKAQAIVEQAKARGTIRSAKLVGLPTSTDLT